MADQRIGNAMQRIRLWAKALKTDVVALWIAARDPRVPWYAKAVAAMVAAYALSPIDLIPDFIPILGYLDDLLIVPLGIWAARSLIPDAVMADLREQARSRERPTSMTGLGMILVSWTAALALLAWLLWPSE